MKNEATDKGFLNNNYLTKKIKKPTDRLIKGAFVLSTGNILTKLLGAFYKIPLVSIIGSKGLGVYQTVFPLYCVLLTFSSTGVPSAISKLIADGNDENEVLKKSLFLLVPIGLLGSLIMAVFSSSIASLQGNPPATLAYIVLSPSVFIVTIISCLRGYFQGKINMSPTALSQIIEQAVKLIFGLSLCYFLDASDLTKGAICCLAVTISEIATVIYLLITLKSNYKRTVSKQKIRYKRLIATLIPITLSTIVIPISRALDSFTVVNFLNDYTTIATNLYGLYTGSVESIASLPIAVCYAIAVAVLPSIAKANSKRNVTLIKTTIFKSISLTLFISSIAGLFLFVFAPTIIKILFNSLPSSEKTITTKLLSLCFFTVIGLSLTQTSNACLIALNKSYAPCLFLLIGVGVKLILEIFLLKNPKINIFGCLYSDMACYFVAVFLNLLYIKYIIAKFPNENSIKTL